MALALLAGTGLAVFAWLSQSLQQAARLREREQQVRLQLTAQQLIDTVDPIRSPDGRLSLGPVEVRWSSRPLQPARRNAVVVENGIGPWSVGLFALDVRAHDASTGADVRFEQWRAAAERVEPVLDLPQ